MKLLIAFLMLLCGYCFAGDDRFGVATHFEQGWSINLMPSIAALGVGYIRDDLYAGGLNTGNRAGDLGWEYPKGVYHVPAFDAAWLKAAHQNGLKVVGVLGPNGNYSDPYDPVAMGNLAAFIAKSGLVDVLEIVNEANNVSEFQGTAGEKRLVDLSNAVHVAVKAAVGGQVPVIGLDEQGSEILYMLGLNPEVQGIVYHPYFNTEGQSGSVYEPPYYNYVAWVNILRSKTTLNLWETEWGTWGSLTNSDPNYSYASQAALILQRLALTQSLKIAHTFIYEFKDNGGEKFGLCDDAGNPKPSYYAVQHFISTLPK